MIGTARNPIVSTPRGFDMGAFADSNPATATRGGPACTDNVQTMAVGSATIAATWWRTPRNRGGICDTACRVLGETLRIRSFLIFSMPATTGKENEMNIHNLSA
ncbi:MAG: hypothetical protein KGY48_07515 [Wenzhouxiangellaceae bacterium]|nr:hypothetical protein [Wenzhouxiangellaceae bacterium]MBS3747593.1 hypothetical protein [Wenzhouxiangellaceae bacterium]